MGRRCFSDKIVESDPFFGLPDNAQALYFHLNMNADDDGFINNAQSVANKVKGGKAALRKLVECRFLLQFGEVYVVKHWRISNSLKNDRLKPLAYAGIAMKIWVKPNRAYTDHPAPGSTTLYEMRTGIRLDSNGNPFGIQLESQPNITQHNLTQPNITQPNITGLEGCFERIVNLFPEGSVGNVESAKEAFRQVVTSQDAAETAVENLKLWKRSEQWTKDGGKYIPYLCNWLLRGTWRTQPKKVLEGGFREPDADEIAAVKRMLEADFADGLD